MRQLKLEKKFNTRWNQYTKELKLKRYDAMTLDEEIKAFDEWEKTKDEKIKDRIINSNVKFAFAVAKQYSTGGNDELLSDLVQECNLGLIEAFDKFDRSLGFKFISFAVWFCRKNCIYYLNSTNSLIRRPSNVVDKERLLINGISDFISKHGHEPSKEDLISILKDKLKNRQNSGNVEAIVDDFLNFKINISSLDSPFESIEDGEVTLKDIIEQDTYDGHREFEERNLKSLIIEKLMGPLSDKERDLIEWKFGFKESNIIQIEKKYDIQGKNLSYMIDMIIRKMKRISSREKISANIF